MELPGSLVVYRLSNMTDISWSFVSSRCKQPSAMSSQKKKSDKKWEQHCLMFIVNVRGNSMCCGMIFANRKEIVCLPWQMVHTSGERRIHLASECPNAPLPGGEVTFRDQNFFRFFFLMRRRWRNWVLSFWRKVTSATFPLARHVQMVTSGMNTCVNEMPKFWFQSSCATQEMDDGFRPGRWNSFWLRLPRESLH